MGRYCTPGPDGGRLINRFATSHHLAAVTDPRIGTEANDRETRIRERVGIISQTRVVLAISMLRLPARQFWERREFFTFGSKWDMTTELTGGNIFSECQPVYTVWLSARMAGHWTGALRRETMGETKTNMFGLFWHSHAVSWVGDSSWLYERGPQSRSRAWWCTRRAVSSFWRARACFGTRNELGSAASISFGSSPPPPPCNKLLLFQKWRDCFLNSD